MDPIWNRDTFEGSLTRMCFSSTPYDAGWDGDRGLGIDGTVLQGDRQMRRLVEMEVALRPVGVRTQQMAMQVKGMPPCGWCFPQFVEAVCTNLGADDPHAATPCGCYVVGGRRLELMANCALCLDAWAKAVPPATTATALQQRAGDGRDWSRIARNVFDALGEPSRPKRLLVRRLLGRLRFWLRAPLGHPKADDNPRLGYFYTHSMGRFGGWDYFSFERHDADVVDLEAQIHAEIGSPKRWLELIDCTWPCAPKVFRYLERLIVAIGRIEQGAAAAPPALTDELPADILQTEGTFLDSDRSRTLFRTALDALGRFLGDEFPVDATPGALDERWAERLADLLGEPSRPKRWPAALLLKRILLFRPSFKRFHFTAGPEQTRSPSGRG
jgi:hypothetical protein